MDYTISLLVLLSFIGFMFFLFYLISEDSMDNEVKNKRQTPKWNQLYNKGTPLEEWEMRSSITNTLLCSVFFDGDTYIIDPIERDYVRMEEKTLGKAMQKAYNLYYGDGFTVIPEDTMEP